MKASVTLLVAALVLLTPAFALDKEHSQTIDTAAVVKNLLHNMKSDNKGVRESSAFMLGDFKCDEAVIPLLAMLHNSPDESSRIVAALSLSKIGAARGTFAVKQAVRFDESPRVRLVCAWFSNQYTQPEPFSFKQVEEVQNLNITQREEH
ncbi:MAG TPA: HEAT repeat domain-containing protein [Bacteroidota bacterium]|nr:HEAT repeat domain-containing protein [Bacteroidota bacterium]